MATVVNWNGTNYSIPAAGEVGWEALSNFLIALGNNAQTTAFQKFASRIATSSPVTVVAATDCVVITDLTVAGAVAVNLPAGVDNQVYCVIDGKGDAHTNNVTITPNGAETIEGAASYVINVARGSALMIFKSGNWSLLSAASIRPPSGAVDADAIAVWSADGSLQNTLAKIDDSGATASTHTTFLVAQTADRTITFPDASITVASRAGAETLSNKTMGSTNTLTGATAGSFTNTGTITLPTSTTTLVGRDTADQGANRLQNKDFDANNCSIVDPTDTTKEINFDASGGATGTATTLASSQTANRTITLPDLAGTVALTGAAQTLTNKIYNGGSASATNRLTSPAETTANLAALQPVAAGSLAYDTTLGAVVYSDGAAWQALASAAVATSTTYGIIKTPAGLSEVHTGNGQGSTGTRVRRFSTVKASSGTSITYTSDATNGDYWTINQDGIYAIDYVDFDSGGVARFGISLNASGGDLSTAYSSLAIAKRLGCVIAQTSLESTITVVKALSSGDVIRCHADGSMAGTSDNISFRISQIFQL